MSRQFDSVTVALTGQLFFILVISAVLALIASYLLLRLYRRAVIKSMRRVGRSETRAERIFATGTGAQAT
jgi:phosphate/sulfate permease